MPQSVTLIGGPNDGETYEVNPANQELWVSRQATRDIGYLGVTAIALVPRWATYRRADPRIAPNRYVFEGERER